jgi:hypothetical protein
VAESQISLDPGPGSDPGTVDSYYCYCYCYCSDSYCCRFAVVRAALDLDPDICADCCYCYCFYSVILLCPYLCLCLYHRLCCRNADFDFDFAVRFAVAAVDGVDVVAVVAVAAVDVAHLHVAFSVDVAVVVVAAVAYLADVAVAAAAAL